MAHDRLELTEVPPSRTSGGCTLPFTKKLARGIILLFLTFSIPFLVAQDQSEGPPPDGTVGTDVFNIAIQGGDPGPGPGPGVFIPPVGPGGPGPQSPGNHIPTINLGKVFGKSD